MYAGIPEMGAKDAWWSTALELEDCKLSRIDFTGGAEDIWKCFDQILRPLLYAIARLAGMPEKVLRAYQSYHEQVLIRNAVAGGLGNGYTKRTGIPLPAEHVLYRAYAQTVDVQGC